jgi:hypothetical protein
MVQTAAPLPRLLKECSFEGQCVLANRATVGVDVVSSGLLFSSTEVLEGVPPIQLPFFVCVCVCFFRIELCLLLLVFFFLLCRRLPSRLSLFSLFLLLFSSIKLSRALAAKQNSGNGRYPPIDKL